MRILMLTCNASLMDGINRHILTVAPALNCYSDVEVAVCTTHPAGELNTALAQAGVKCYALNCAHGHTLPIVWRFWKVMRDFRPDIIHGHVISFLVGAVLRRCFADVKCVVTVHGITDPPLRVNKLKLAIVRIFHRQLARLFSPKKHHTIYISRGVQGVASGQRRSVIYNPIDIKRSQPPAVTLHTLLGVPADTPIIGTACRIAPVKQPHVFVEVMCQVLQQVTSAHAVVLGEDRGGEIVEALQREVDARGLRERFHFLGYRSDAAQLIRSLRCFVLTSQREGMPTALMEAMVAHVPIAFMEGEGGLIDLTEINKETPFAIVAPANESKCLAEQIVLYLGHTEMRERLIASANVVLARHFDLERVIKQLVDIYKKVIEEER